MPGKLKLYHTCPHLGGTDVVPHNELVVEITKNTEGNRGKECGSYMGKQKTNEEIREKIGVEDVGGVIKKLIWTFAGHVAMGEGKNGMGRFKTK